MPSAGLEFVTVVVRFLNVERFSFLIVEDGVQKFRGQAFLRCVCSQIYGREMKLNLMSCQ